MKARLKDVAARAGVAVNTASMILNRRPNSWASKKTEERVFKAAEELHYRPSRTAVALRLGKMSVIGLVIPDLQNPYYTLLSDILETEINSVGYDMIIESSRSDTRREAHCLEDVIERQVDGVLCCLIDNEAHRPFLQEQFDSGKPIVAMAEAVENPLPVDAVTINFNKGMTDALWHLVNLGHQRIAFLAAVAEGQGEGSRPDVFRRLMKESGLAEQNAFFPKSSHRMSDARKAARELIEQTKENRPTAFITHNDLAAIGVMRAAVDLGLRVPHDLSVIGVDNIPLAAHLPVALTTVDQPMEAMVKAAAELLLKRIQTADYPPPQTREFETRLIVRESTSPPAAT